MSSQGPIDLRCEITSFEESIEGRVSDRRGRSVPFHGWIELAAALTALAEGAERQEPDPPREEQSDE